MTTTEDRLAKKAMIPRLFKGFPSWAGKVTIDLINDYLEYVDDVSAEAVERAIKTFRSGGMDRDNGFPLTGPELAEIAHKAQVEIDMEQFWDKNDFLEVGSPEWKAICEATGVKSMPTIEYKGPNRKFRGMQGWYVTTAEMKQHAALIEKYRAEAKRIEARGPLRLVAPVPGSAVSE
jgi:hypothetical protein